MSVILLAVTCHKCTYLEIVEGEDDLKDFWNDYYKRNNQWDEDCEKSGNQAKTCELVPPDNHEVMYCAQTTQRLEVTMNGELNCDFQRTKRGSDKDYKGTRLPTNELTFCCRYEGLHADIPALLPVTFWRRWS